MRVSENDRPHWDVIVIGGGPAASTIGSLLARDGYSVILLERDIHPRDHVGESLTPSTNLIFERIGFQEKMEDAGFVHKPGAAWTSPRAPLGTFFSIRLAEFAMPGAKQPYTYNIERDEFDTLLLRHAHDQGAKVLEGVNVQRVLFDGERAVGVRVRVVEGWEQDLFAKVVVDASGRRCLLANQLGLRKKDPRFKQYSIYSWFRGVEPNPLGFEGVAWFYFLGLERAWAWSLPLRDGKSSIGVVTTKEDFQKSGRTHEEFFASLVNLNRSFRYVMRGAERIRPWWIEADYSYKVDTLHGPGWLLIGDALRFVDPIFSTGVDIAMFSAAFAHQAIAAVLTGDDDEERAFKGYESHVSDGIETWYRLIDLFYTHPHMLSRYAASLQHREDVIRTLQGNLYLAESLERAQRVIGTMELAHHLVMADPDNLLRPGAIEPALNGPDELPTGSDDGWRLGYTGPAEVVVRDAEGVSSSRSEN
ncbi:MAG TPA: NAD(P)/FAD-dependent oxidoreductase [Actinomycetota bacterium]|nr:NAD(P)/FAD-dependent oxidoreductase [Actinomycetota bacterium]